MEIYDVADLERIDIPVSGATCRIEGFFFYRIADGSFPKCYLGNAPENPSLCVSLHEDIGEAVLSGDETFGMLVGGEFAYFGLACAAEGVLHRDAECRFSLSMVSRMTLTKDGVSQDFLML